MLGRYGWIEVEVDRVK